MNDLDLVRELRADVPVPDAVRLADGRARLLTVAGRERPGAGRRTRRSAILVPATAAAAAVAIAAGATGYALSAGGPASHPAVEPPAAAWPSGSAVQVTLAVRVLREASAVVGGAPVTAEPSPGQWIYVKSVQYRYPGGTSSNEEWTTFDGSKTAYYANGRLIVHTTVGGAGDAERGSPLAPQEAYNGDATPRTAYDALAALPTEPRALLNVVEKAAVAYGAANLAAGTPVASGTPKTNAQLEFDYLSLLLWNAAGGVGGPPKAEAAAFRAMATLPGIAVQRGIMDVAGAPAIGISADGSDQILLDPRTYQVIGLRQLSTGISPLAGPLPPAVAKRIALLPEIVRHKIEQKRRAAIASPPSKGTVVYSLALGRVAEVDGPGIR